MQAFVGYRDFGCRQRYSVLDFLSPDDHSQFEPFLQGIGTEGNDDWCEDVAGGLEVRCGTLAIGLRLDHSLCSRHPIDPAL